MHFTPNTNKDINYELINYLKMLSRVPDRDFKSQIETYLNEWYKNIETVTEDRTIFAPLLDQVRQIGQILIAASKDFNMQWWMKQRKNMFGILKSEIKEKIATGGSQG